MLKIVQYPPTVHSLQPKAPGWPWESCAAHLSSTPTAPHHPRLQPLQPSLCPNAVSCHHLLFLLCPFFPGALISCDSDTPNSPLFTGRDTVQTSAPLGASVSNSGLPSSITPRPLERVLPKSEGWVAVLLTSPDVCRIPRCLKTGGRREL